MSFLFFIPARKNSKEIKNKNLINLNNKPLILHTLDFVKKVINSNKNKINFDYLISTDSKKIINICEKNNFKINYLRPKYLSEDNSSIVDGIIHAIQWIRKKNLGSFKSIIVLQPTNPNRSVEEFNKILKYYTKSRIKSLVSVINLREHPYESIEIDKNKWKFLRKLKNNHHSRQKYKNNFFFIDGTYYISDINFIIKNKKLVKENVTKPYFINRNWHFDIDNYTDLKIARCLYDENNLYNFK